MDSKMLKIAGIKFKQIRDYYNFPKERLAVLANITPGMITDFENGKESLGVTTVEYMLDMFGCTLEDLNGENKFDPDFTYDSSYLTNVQLEKIRLYNMGKREYKRLVKKGAIRERISE